MINLGLKIGGQQSDMVHTYCICNLYWYIGISNNDYILLYIYTYEDIIHSIIYESMSVYKQTNNDRNL